MLLHHLLDNLFAHKMRLPAHIVKLRSDLHQLHHSTNHAAFSRILVPNDGFSHTLGLGNRRPKLLQLRQSNESALKLKREVRSRTIAGGCAYVVKQAGKSPGFEEGIGDPGREVLGYNRVPWGVY
jgi:hypothetical protein